MASPFQQQALHRKLVYVFLIVGLFTASLLFRNHVVEPRAEELALREQNVGAVDLSGSALRLSLTGMRGVASCILWHNAIEQQKKNQWDELEILVNSITKLQPHFITPWLFQSWNLSYNVSVQCDLPRDKYFYIARGIQLLADGERQNQDQPELRFAMGTYYHQKISMHDHKVPLQTLFELSGIDPLHRDPTWLKEPDKDGRPRYETFLCAQHPRLVRRLREKLGCTTLKQVFEYLEDNKKVPTLYGDKVDGDGDDQHTRYKPNKEKPFPVLPPPEGQRYEPMGLPSAEELGGEFDALSAGRLWYEYAQKPLPPPDDVVPSESQPITDRIHQRLPVHMTTIIFRDYPALVQNALGERLEEEGWFDGDGWKVPGWFPGDRFANGQEARVGAGREWHRLPRGNDLGDGWGRASQAWDDFSKANHLAVAPEEREALMKKAEKFLKKHNALPGTLPPPLRGRDRDDPEMVEGRRAAEVLFGLSNAERLVNYTHNSSRARLEAKPETVAVRKALYEAEQLRLAARAQAVPKYEAALKAWAKILAANPAFRDSQAIGEDSFEAEWNYIQLFQGTPTAPLLKQQLFAQALLGQAALPGPDLSLLALARLARPQAVAAPVLVGPLDGLADDGHPILEQHVINAVLHRKRLIHETPTPPPGGRMPPGMRPGMTMPPGAPGAPPPGPGAPVPPGGPAPLPPPGK